MNVQPASTVPAATGSALDALVQAAIAPTLRDDERPGELGGMCVLVAAAERPLPLRGMKVRSRIVSGIAQVDVAQTFENAGSEALEAIWRFPLPTGAAIRGLRLRCGALEVAAELRPTAQAREVFDAARQAGHTAALLEQVRDDVHVLRVTRLPAGEQVQVHFSLDLLLPEVDGARQFRFPLTIAPRYLPGTAVGQADGAAQPDTDRVPDGSRLQPPLRLAGGVPLDLEVEVMGPIAGIESSQHAVRLDLDGGGVRVAPSTKASLDRDFVLAVRGAAERDRPAARAWRAGGHTLLEVLPPEAPDAPALPRDAIFCIDISGSMHGAKLDAAKRALRAALRSLLPQDRFGVIAFDTAVETLSPVGARHGLELLDYSAANVRRAEAWIDALAPRGGTEMLAPLQLALGGETEAGRLRTVLFATDGQAWNEDELARAVAARVGSGARLLTLGIDTAPNESLLSRLARAGQGAVEYVGPDGELEAAVARLEAGFGSPRLRGLQVMDAASGLPVMTDGLGRPDVFDGRPLTLLLEGAPSRLRLRAEAPADFAVEVEVMDALPEALLPSAAALFARRRILALQDRLALRPFEAEAIEPEIEALSLRHGVLSRRTAWVAVERRRTVEGELLVVEQPAEQPQGWADPGDAMITGSFAVPAPAPLMSAPPPPMHATVRRAMASMPSAPMPGGRAPSQRKARSAGVLKRAVEAAMAPIERLRAAPAPEPVGASMEETLARQVGVDGSFCGGDGAPSVLATAIALALLLGEGSTRRRGVRRRLVSKVAAWLEANAAGVEPALAALVRDVLAALQAAEDAGGQPALDPELAGTLAEAAANDVMAAGQPGALVCERFGV